MSAFFAAANPERVSKLILFGGYAKAFLTEEAVSQRMKIWGTGAVMTSRVREPVDKSSRDQTVRQIRAAFREPRNRQGIYVVEQADRRDVDIAEASPFASAVSIRASRWAGPSKRTISLLMMASLLDSGAHRPRRAARPGPGAPSGSEARFQLTFACGHAGSRPPARLGILKAGARSPTQPLQVLAFKCLSVDQLTIWPLSKLGSAADAPETGPGR